ncbi:MAG: hypothetical protein ACRC8A_09905 [Microcoleaceae cyanobacterium]
MSKSWTDPYEELGLRCNPFIAEQTAGVSKGLWLDRGFSQAPQPGRRMLVQFMGEKGAGKTSHLLHWQQQTGGSYAYYPPGWGRWQIPPIEPIAYWDEADRIPLPLLFGALAQASRQRATIVVGTHRDLSWAGRSVGLKVRTIQFSSLTPEAILAWAKQRIEAARLPGCQSVDLQLHQAEIEQIATKSGTSWRKVATELHILAAQVAHSKLGENPPNLKK